MNEQELVAAMVAKPALGAVALPVADDEQFIVTDIQRMVTPRVAAVTGRDEVRRGVVGFVVVEMVGNKGTRRSALPRHPDDGRFAPVASVTAGADFVVEHQPMNREFARDWMRVEWMTRWNPTKVVGLLAFAWRFLCGQSSAGVRAEPRRFAVCGVVRSAEWRLALFTRPGPSHWATISHFTER
jgi:hypothetical protein